MGALAILAACFLWGVDNHLARYLSAKDPLALVSVRGIAAGSISLLLAIFLGQLLPSWPVVLGGLALGFVSYGLALALFVRAMRDLGATRATAFFGLAPFVGAALAFVLFRDSPGPLLLVSLPFMVAGAWLLATERHSHWHIHQPLVHEHRHRHDEGHHLHVHPGGEPAPQQAHSHWHAHEVSAHNHPHTPDLHHRHPHRGGSAPTDQDRLPPEQENRQAQEE
jgi:multidrug transporter EmrE-like cation transporter